MDPLISFAIPLYNKGPYIAEVVERIHRLCKSLNGRYEICISDNASNDLEEGLVEHLSKRGLLAHCRISRLDVIISGPENWLYALGLCSAPIVKLQLADDTICNFDLKSVLTRFEESKLSFIVGKSRPIIHSEDSNEVAKLTGYYESVNSMRRNIFSNCNPQSFLRSATPGALFSGGNIFGDINALIMRKECVDRLREPIFQSAFPAILCWPDWEIYTKLALRFTGDFVDEFISDFVYNSTSSYQIAALNPSVNQRVFLDIEATLRMSPLINPETRRILANQMNEQQRASLFSVTLKELLKVSGLPWRARINSLLRQLVSTALIPMKSFLRSMFTRLQVND